MTEIDRIVAGLSDIDLIEAIISDLDCVLSFLNDQPVDADDIAYAQMWLPEALNAAHILRERFIKEPHP